MLNIEKIINNEDQNIAQYNQVMQGRWLNYEEGVHWYIDEWFKKSDKAERRLDEARRLSYKERRVNT